MDAFALRYGNQSVTLAQSKHLFGIKPRPNKADHAREAIQRTLPARSWTPNGTLGGFQLVAICDRSVDADQALDQIRLDASVLVGTHVFELPERRGIFVPTGELFVGFKTGTSSQLKQTVIDEFGVSVKQACGVEGLFLAVTARSPNPIKVALELRRKSFVCVAEPDLASRKATIEVLRLPQSAVAHPHRLTPRQLLGSWRRTREGENGAPWTGAAYALGRAKEPRPRVLPGAPTIEISVGAVTVRVPAGTDLPTLQAVLHAVRTIS